MADPDGLSAVSGVVQSLRTADGRVVEVEAVVVGDAVTVSIDGGQPRTASFRRLPDGGLHLDLDGQGTALVHSQVDSRQVRISLGGRTVELDRIDSAGGGADDGADADSATAPMPGKVVEVNVAAGDAVALGDPLVGLEAMKLNNAVEAPRAGVVASVEVQVGDQVGPGDTLVRLQPEEAT